MVHCACKGRKEEGKDGEAGFCADLSGKLLPQDQLATCLDF